jgi:hypothetical protein
VGSCAWPGAQEAERAYQLWKARQVVDQQGGGAVAVVAVEEEEKEEEGGKTRGEKERRLAEATPEERGKQGQDAEAGKALVDFVLHHLKGDLFPDLMDMMR